MARLHRPEVGLGRHDRTDGTGAERVGPAVASWGDLDTQPSPSPDGRRIVRSSTRGHIVGMGLSILDVDTRTVTHLPVAGGRPRWSPTGEWIAYMEDAGYAESIRRVPPDGSDAQEITFSNVLYRASVLDWSPDGKYLLVRGNHGLDIVDVARRSFVELPTAALLHEAVWTRRRPRRSGRSR